MLSVQLTYLIVFTCNSCKICILATLNHTVWFCVLVWEIYCLYWGRSDPLRRHDLRLLSKSSGEPKLGKEGPALWKHFSHNRLLKVSIIGQFVAYTLCTESDSLQFLHHSTVFISHSMCKIDKSSVFESPEPGN